mmetsp:Transcript_53712/g.143678  ORF Transcript_53712/g.143678 Transcript_53712/m.143678 type:complete len:232 (+) Transcript_53712:1009-1704(+)
MAHSKAAAFLSTDWRTNVRSFFKASGAYAKAWPHCEVASRIMSWSFLNSRDTESRFDQFLLTASIARCRASSSSGTTPPSTRRGREGHASEVHSLLAESVGLGGSLYVKAVHCDRAPSTFDVSSWPILRVRLSVEGVLQGLLTGVTSDLYVELKVVLVVGLDRVFADASHRNRFRCFKCSAICCSSCACLARASCFDCCSKPLSSLDVDDCVGDRWHVMLRCQSIELPSML